MGEAPFAIEVLLAVDDVISGRHPMGGRLFIGREIDSIHPIEKKTNDDSFPVVECSSP